MSINHLVVLSSICPDLGHFRAGQTVLALLALELAALFPKVTIATCGAANETPAETGAALASKGVDLVRLDTAISASSEPKSRSEALYRHCRSIFLNDGQWDTPRPKHPRELGRAIKALDADAVLLFWDTIAEFSIPELDRPAFGYLARPPQAAAISRVRERPRSLGRALTLWVLNAQHRRHLARMRLLKRAANICALDTAYLKRKGVRCTYVSNTWADNPGRTWEEMRRKLEGEKAEPQILANIGSLDATGNSYGVRYFAEEMFPRLLQRCDGLRWRVSICGRGGLPQDLSIALDHPRIDIKGFVPDIDAELMSSAVMLLLNNMGPYTGGYTRVAFAFSTGACLVASERLRHSMPELVDGENCMLGRNADEILRRVEAALTDPELRFRLGRAARKTYETVYSPGSVARRIRDMLTSGTA